MTTSNALLITIDSLRADHLSSAGYDRSTTPTIDELAADGLSFSQATANGPSTRSSFPSILTSTYPFMYGGYSYLADERPFLARTFQEAGFRTAAFHSNPHVGAKQNYDTGFESFADTAESSESVATLKDRIERRLDPDSLLYRLLRRVYHTVSATTDSGAYAKADTINDQATDWLESEWDREEPFFLWIHYMDVHYPFMPPDQFVTELGLEPLPKRRVVDLNGRMQESPESLTDEDVADLQRLYDAEIRYTDHHVDRLLSQLSELGVRDETAVVVCADHGEAFGEHGRFGHHPYLYDELLRVPLVIDAPDVPSRTDPAVASLLDIGPTLYDLTDVPTPEAAQGESLLELLDGDSDRVAISASAGCEYLATRTADWKCFWRRDDDEVELYDLESDPDELEDVSGSHPEVVERFREVMEARLAEADSTDTTLPDVEHSEEVTKRLRDLGYTE